MNIIPTWREVNFNVHIRHTLTTEDRTIIKLSRRLFEKIHAEVDPVLEQQHRTESLYD